MSILKHSANELVADHILPYYDPYSESLICYYRDVPGKDTYLQWVNDDLTLILHNDDDSIVGVELHNINNATKYIYFVQGMFPNWSSK